LSFDRKDVDVLNHTEIYCHLCPYQAWAYLEGAAGAVPPPITQEMLVPVA